MRALLVARHYYHCHYYYYGSTNVWMSRVKNKSFGRAANRNQQQHRLKLKSCHYADINGFLNPSIITGENYRPDLLFLILSNCLYVVELTVGFESNRNNNAVRKKEKYLNLIKEMSRNYRCVKFVNLSISSLGVFSDECSTFLDIMNDIGIEKKQQHFVLIKTMINIAIRATY